ncbi:MAG: TonB-dependent receptor [Bacteroidia bacterium]|nr:TonB-dependent receptor [Bacteroidia bacterium]
MEKKQYSFFAIIIFCANMVLASPYPEQKTSLTGNIKDKQTGEALPGVTIYIPDLKTGAVSTIDGTYKIENLPSTKILVQVSFLGYKTIIEMIDLSSTASKDFVMEISIKEINEVVVTGTSKATEIRKSPIPIVAIDKNHIDQNLNTNVIDVIAQLPGVSTVTTGPNVSKPFIRGLGYNRVLTLFDGVRQEGQQWGDEHGVEVDEFSVDRIEVVKGPASLIYGSDALAGVVNLMPAPPVLDGILKGSILSNYQTNNGLIGNSFALAGNNNGFVWGGRISNKIAGNYQNKQDGRVYGTSFKETDGNGYIGLNKHWGYSHLKFSVFDDLQSIPDGSRDSTTRRFTKQITEADSVRPIVSEEELNSYTIPLVHQHIQHYKIISTSNFIINNSKLGLNLGYQQNIRREFTHPQRADIAGLYLILNSYTYDIKYHLPEKNGWEATIGINGMYQDNSNKGTEFIIPDYTLFDIGPFAFIKKSFSKLDLSIGLRYDSRSFKNEEMYITQNSETGFDMQTYIPDTVGASHPFLEYIHTFSGYSGSIGATYSLSDNFFIKANIARGYRAPNISEISSNGVHPGINIYQIGNPDFKSELSLQEDLGLFFSSQHLTCELDFFNNNISNYIYNEKVLNDKGQDSIVVPGNQTFQYQAAMAQLYGAEASIDIHPHPLDWLHFENSISILSSLNKGVKGIPITDSAKYLPFIPPMHTHTELRADIKKKFRHFSSVYVKLEMEYFAKQNKAYLAFNTETVTPSYTLFNAGIGVDVTNRSGKVLFSFHMLGNNIADVTYQAHLSRLKYFENYPNNGSGTSGIYNMGRNLSFKLLVPMNFKK